MNEHIQNVYEEGELEPEATFKKYLIVQNEGSKQKVENIWKIQEIK